MRAYVRACVYVRACAGYFSFDFGFFFGPELAVIDPKRRFIEIAIETFIEAISERAKEGEKTGQNIRSINNKASPLHSVRLIIPTS